MLVVMDRIKVLVKEAGPEVEELEAEEQGEMLLE
jgi:hypothetical protein